MEMTRNPRFFETLSINQPLDSLETDKDGRISKGLAILYLPLDRKKRYLSQVLFPLYQLVHKVEHEGADVATVG